MHFANTLLILAHENKLSNMATISMLVPFSQNQGFWWFGIDFTIVVNRWYELSRTLLFNRQSLPCCTTKYIFKLGKNKFDRGGAIFQFNC